MLLSTLATLVGLAFLAWILWETLRQGIGALDLKLFTRITAYGEDGGLLNAMVGSADHQLHRHRASPPRSACWPAPGWPSTRTTPSSGK